MQTGGAALSEAAAARGGGGGGCGSRRGGGAGFGIRVPGGIVAVGWCPSARVPFGLPLLWSDCGVFYFVRVWLGGSGRDGAGCVGLEHSRNLN